MEENTWKAKTPEQDTWVQTAHTVGPQGPYLAVRQDNHMGEAACDDPDDADQIHMDANKRHDHGLHEQLVVCIFLVARQLCPRLDVDRLGRNKVLRRAGRLQRTSYIKWGLSVLVGAVGTVGAWASKVLVAKHISNPDVASF